MRRKHNYTLGRSRQMWVYTVFAVLFATGAAWLAVHSTDLEIAEWRSRLAVGMLRLHGAAAMVALVLLGVLWVEHMRPAWRAGRNRLSGGGLVGTCVLLAATGYGLYYAGGETLRVWLSRGHSWLGLAFPAGLAFHVWRGRMGRTDPAAITPRSRATPTPTAPRAVAAVYDRRQKPSD